MKNTKKNTRRPCNKVDSIQFTLYEPLNIYIEVFQHFLSTLYLIYIRTYEWKINLLVRIQELYEAFVECRAKPIFLQADSNFT